METAIISPNGHAPRVLDLERGPRPFKWLDFEAPTDEQIDELGREYPFHPLALDDVRTFDQRAKLQDFGDYLFLSLHTLSRSGRETLRDHELEAFLGPDYLITLHREPMPLLEDVRQRFEGDKGKGERGADFLLYVIVDEMVEAIFPVLDGVEEEIDTLEDQTIEKPTPETLQSIFHLKRELIEMRRTIAPMREVMIGLASARYGLVDNATALYYRDVYDHLARIHELIETERDLLGSALDTYLSVVSNRLNEVMKRLTLIATIFLPISFLVGMGGMNFPQFPFENWLVYGALMAALVLVPTGMLVYFWKQGWL